MYFINFAGAERRIDPTKGKYFYSPSQQTQSKVVTPEAAESKSKPKVSNANSRTPTKANAGGMRVARKRKGSGSNVYKRVSDVDGRAYKNAIKSRNKLGAKVGKAIQKVAGGIKANPGKIGLGLAVAGGLGYAASKALQNREPKSLQDRVSSNPLIRKLGAKIRKMRSDKGRKRK